MRSIVFGAFLVGLAPACLLLSPLDEATPDFGYAGNVGSGGTAGKGSAGSAGKGTAGSAGKGNGGASSGGNSGSGGAPPATHTCSDPLMIDDMEAPGHTSNICQGNRNGGWYVYTDGTGSTTPAPSTPTGPPFPYTALDVPRAGSTYAAHVSTTGQTEYGGMGVSMLYPNVAYDVSAYAGIQFWARGRGSLRVALPTVQTQEIIQAGGECVSGALSCSDHYVKGITLTDAWQQHTVSFGELAQGGWGVPAAAFFVDQLLNIEFAWDALASADIWIDDLKFYVGDCDSSTYVTSCPTGTTQQTCWYNTTTRYNCSEYCPMIGFVAAPECTDGSCVCGGPMRPDCADGAVFICDCFELAGSPCVPGELGDLYRGCFREAQGYEGVSCTYDYVPVPYDPLAPAFVDACLAAEAACLQ